MPRKERRIRVTSEVREPLDVDMIAQVLLDFLSPAQVQALIEKAGCADGPRSDPRVWREDDGGRSPS